MKRIALALLVLPLVGLSTTAQPQHGDLVLSFVQRTGTQITGGFTAFVDPNNPGSWSTLAPSASGYWHNWVGMAADNMDLMIAETNALVFRTYMVQSDPAGNVTTVSPTIGAKVDGFDLDHDGQWIAATGGGNFSALYGLTPTAAQRFNLDFLPGFYNEMTIDRDPGGPVYAIAVFHLNTFTGLARKILGADRTGVVTTIVQGTGNPLMGLAGIELHPRSGDYITTDFYGPSSGDPNGTEISRVTKGGQVTNVTAFVGANAARIGQDDTLWVAGCVSGSTVLKYDLTNNAVLGIVQVPLPSGACAAGIEIYGSRPLVCRQNGTSAAVSVQSRHGAAPGALYTLAASFARRPGLLLNGEYLDLDTTDPLFYLSALNLLPTIFQGFQGQLNAAGNAMATVNIPGPLVGSGITIFVAGIIYNPSGIVQVTNTHWLVL